MKAATWHSAVHRWLQEGRCSQYQSSCMTLHRALFVFAGPSYNVAFFPKIYEAAGYPSLLEHMRKEGPEGEYADPINWLLYQVGPMRPSTAKGCPSDPRVYCLLHFIRGVLTWFVVSPCSGHSKSKESHIW